MTALMQEQIQNMHIMLTETKEKVHELTAVVKDLHSALAGGGYDNPPPPPIVQATAMDEGEDDEEMLREKNIIVGSKELMDILEISTTTLKRWRKENVIPFRYHSSCQVTYKLLNIYIEIKSGRLRWKGFNSITATERIIKFAKNARLIHKI